MRYKVEVRRTQQEVCYVEVEAENESDAEELACEKADEDDSVEWDYITCTGCEAYEVEEVK